MNSLFIAVLSSFCGFMIGLALTKRNKERENYYRDAVKLCSHLINNISYKADKISSVISGAEVDSAALKKNIAEYETYLGGGEFSLSDNCLTKKEGADVKAFFMELGRYDGDTQLSELRRREGEFKQKFNDIKAKNDKQGNMYIKLGLLVGLLIGILLI